MVCFASNVSLSSTWMPIVNFLIVDVVKGMRSASRFSPVEAFTYDLYLKIIRMKALHKYTPKTKTDGRMMVNKFAS